MNKIIELYRTCMMIFSFAFFGLGALFVRYIIFPVQKLLTKSDNKFMYYETLQKVWQIFIWFFKAIGMIKLEISGIERLKNIKNSIIVSTHPSFLDIVILISIIPHTTCFVAERLANNPFFKGMVKKLFILEGQTEWIKHASDKLEGGLNIVMFPMGVRHRKNEYPRIRRGASLLAQKSGKNVSLIRMNTNYDFLFIHQPFYKAGSEPALFRVEYAGEIDIQEALKNMQDEVSFKTEITKQIKQILYEK